MAHPASLVLSLHTFPLVTVDGSKLSVHGIDGMISDLERLLEEGRVFVLGMPDNRRDHAHQTEERKRWVLWLKQNRERLAAACRGFLYLADPDADLALQAKQVAGLQAMLQIPVVLANDAGEFEQRAHSLMSDDTGR